MSKRHEELKQLAISHVTHHDNGEFANLLELAMANGKNIYHAIASTYIHFPITSGKPSINALVELENFAASRYEGLSLAEIRQASTFAMKGDDADVRDAYLTVISKMYHEEAFGSVVKGEMEDDSAADRA